MNIFKILKGVLCLALTVVLAGGSAGCNKEGGNSNSSGGGKTNFEFYPAKTDIKTDGQAYQKEGIEFPSSLWSVPAAERREDMDRGDVKAYFIDSIDGTEVFAYVGIPDTATKDSPVPAVVLVHGGAGTAFFDWVKMWTDIGYAAISMDTEGKMPGSGNSTMSPKIAESDRLHGPANSAFGDSAKPINEQWTYHALASVFAATSFIASFDEVDETKIGITGVSYGSFLCTLAAVYDDRYSFCAPVYGSLSNAWSKNEFGRYVKNGDGSTVETWDDEAVLKDNRTPFLFVSSTNDQFFAPDSITRCAEQVKYAQIVFKPGLTHGHYQGADIREIFDFADEIFYHRNSLVRIEGDPNDGMMELKIPGGVTITKAEVVYTFDEDTKTDTTWLAEDAEIDGKYVIYNTNNAKHLFVRVYDSSNRCACSYVSNSPKAE